MGFLFDLFQKVCEIYVNNSVWFTILAMLLTFIVPKIFPLKKFIKVYKLKKILKLKKTDTLVSIPFYSNNRITSSGKSEKIDSTSHAEIRGVMTVIKNCKKANPRYSVDITPYIDDQYRVDISKNRFVCGGPYVNADTYDLLTQCFATIKFESAGKRVCEFPAQHRGYEKFSYVNSNNLDKKIKTILIYEEPQKPDNLSNDVLENFKQSDKKSQAIVYDSETENVIFVIRLLGDKNFSNKNHGTVHIIFGVNSNATYLSSQFYYEHASKLYEILKNDNHSKEFAYAFKIKNSKEVLFNVKYDLTKFIRVKK